MKKCELQALILSSRNHEKKQLKKLSLSTIPSALRPLIFSRLTVRCSKQYTAHELCAKGGDTAL